jgi:hypothetical protein
VPGLTSQFGTSGHALPNATIAAEAGQIVLLRGGLVEERPATSPTIGSLVSIPDDTALDCRRRADPRRGRRNFDLHRRFGPFLRDWYGALDGLDPGRVRWAHPAAIPDGVERDRYDNALFEAWMKAVPRVVI